MASLGLVYGKPGSLAWAQERGKEDELSVPRESRNLISTIGGVQFADIWLGKLNEAYDKSWAQVCEKPRSLAWAQERGKEDKGVQFADIWLGKYIRVVASQGSGVWETLVPSLGSSVEKGRLVFRAQELLNLIWAQLFKTNDVVS